MAIFAKHGLSRVMRNFLDNEHGDGAFEMHSVPYSSYDLISKNIGGFDVIYFYQMNPMGHVRHRRR